MTTFNDSIITNNFRGIQRINSSFSSAGISASDMQNVELFNTGINSGIGIRTMKGNSSVFEFSNPDEKIISLYESVQKSQKYFFVYTETAKYSLLSSGYYNMSNIKLLIQNAKYKHKGYFDDKLLERTLKAFNKHYSDRHFDFILFIPPTVSGDLVENFANRISVNLNIPIKKDLTKLFQPEIPLKQVQSKLKKRELLKGIFNLENKELYQDKSILLVDDIIDSGITIDEAAKMLLKNGVSKVSVLTIAKTNVGDD